MGTNATWMIPAAGLSTFAPYQQSWNFGSSSSNGSNSQDYGTDQAGGNRGAGSGGVVNQAAHNIFRRMFGLDDDDQSGWAGGYGGGGGGGYNTGVLISNTEKLAKDAAKGLAEGLKSQLDTLAQMDNQNKTLAASQKREQALEADEKFFANQQHLQSVFSAMRNNSGNAMQGSGLSDLIMLAKRYDDMSDSANLSALRQANQSTEDNLFSQLSQNWQARSNAYTEFLDKYRQLGQNLAADVSNVDPNKGAEYFSGDNLNWTGSKLNWLNSYMDDIRKQQKDNAVPVLQQMSYFRPDGANYTQSGGSTQNAMGNVNTQYWQNLSLGYDNRKAKGD